MFRKKSGSPDILLLTNTVEHPYLRHRSYILHKGEVLPPLEVHEGRRDYQDRIQGKQRQEEYKGGREEKASFDE